MTKYCFWLFPLHKQNPFKNRLAKNQSRNFANINRKIQTKPAIYGHNEESGYVRLLYCKLIEQNRHHFTVCADGFCHVLNILRIDTLILLKNACSSEIRHLRYILHCEMCPKRNAIKSKTVIWDFLRANSHQAKAKKVKE